MRYTCQRIRGRVYVQTYDDWGRGELNKTYLQADRMTYAKEKGILAMMALTLVVVALEMRTIVGTLYWARWRNRPRSLLSFDRPAKWVADRWARISIPRLVFNVCISYEFGVLPTRITRYQRERTGTAAAIYGTSVGISLYLRHSHSFIHEFIIRYSSHHESSIFYRLNHFIVPF